MSILRRTIMTPATEDLDFFVDGVELTEDEPFVLEATAAPDGLAHQIVIDASGDINAAVFTVVGTDADDNAITEDITGVTTNAVESTKYFKTITSITPDTTSAETVDIGFVDEVVSESLPLNYHSAIGPKFFLDVTGTLNVDVQFTIADPALFAEQNDNKWVEPSSSLAAETADSSAVVAIDPGYGWYRVQWNSYSAGAEIALYASQPN